MKYYAVIDTNVVVSAMLKWNSAPGSVVELAVTGTIVPLLNSEIVAEYRAVLSRPKFGLTADIVEDFIGALEKTEYMQNRMQQMSICRTRRTACSMK